MESCQEKKAGSKHTKFGLKGLLTIKNTIRDSFSSFLKSERERPRQNYTSSHVEPQTSDAALGDNLPCFMSVVESPSQFQSEDESERFESHTDLNPRQTPQLITFKPEMDVTATNRNYCQDGPACIEQKSTLYSRVESIEFLDDKTISKRECKPTDAEHKHLVFSGPAIYTEPVKRCTQNKGFNSLSLPASIQARRNSPIYEPVAPAYPPKNYDQQKEHAGIIPHQMDLALGEDERNRISVAHPNFLGCRNVPGTSFQNCEPFHYKSERECNELVTDGTKLINDKNEVIRKMNTTTACPKSQESKATQTTMYTEDKATQIHFELFKDKDIQLWFRSEESSKGIKEALERAMNTGQEVSDGQQLCLIDVTEAQISTEDHQLDPLISSKYGSLTNLAIERELIIEKDMDQNPQDSKDLSPIKFNTVPTFKVGLKPQYLPPYLAGPTRLSAEDTRSIFSSEGAESDFIFYPCEKAVVEDVLDGTGNTPCSSQFRSCTCAHQFSLSHGDESSRSDFYGSSLDEVTRQFFLDDEVLSDDVFMSETEQHGYPSWKYQNETSPKRPQSIKENCQNQRFGFDEHNQSKPLYGKTDISFGEWGTDLWHAYLQKHYKSGMGAKECVLDRSIHDSGSSMKSDETYSYKYDDIDEVLKNFRDLSASSYPSRSENDTEVTDLSDSDVSTKDGTSNYDAPNESQGIEKAYEDCERSDPSLTRVQDHNAFPERPQNLRLSCGCCEEIDSEFADVFDSLRKNSLQFKSRQMWRKRRTNRKRDIFMKHNGSFSKGDTSTMRNCSETHSQTCSAQNTYMLSSSDRENSSPSKPIRGILKKTVLIQPISIAERNLCDFDTKSKTVQCNKNNVQRRRAKSLGLEVYPLEETEAMFGREILDSQYKVAKAHSPQSPVHAPSFNTIIEQAGNKYRLRRSNSLPAGSHNWFKDCYRNNRYEMRPKESLNPIKETKSTTLRHSKTLPTEKPSRIPTSTVFTGSNIQLINCVKAPTVPVHSAECALQNKTTKMRNGNNNPPKFLHAGQLRSCAQRYNTENGISSNTFYQPIERQREFITVRKNSLDLYKWSSSLHRRRKPLDKRYGPTDNPILLQRAIRLCTSRRPTTTL